MQTAASESRSATARRARSVRGSGPRQRADAVSPRPLARKVRIGLPPARPGRGPPRRPWAAALGSAAAGPLDL